MPMNNIRVLFAQPTFLHLYHISILPKFPLVSVTFCFISILSGCNPFPYHLVCLLHLHIRFGNICGERRKYSHFTFFFTFLPFVTFHLRVHFYPVRLFFPFLRNSLFFQISFFYFSIIRTKFHPLFNRYLNISLDLLSINVNTKNTLSIHLFFFFLLLIFNQTNHLNPCLPHHPHSL